MPISTFDQLLRPILELAAKQSITRRLVYEAMANEFNLTEKERNETIASGSLVFVWRASWAMSHLTKASLIELEAKHTYRANAFDENFNPAHFWQFHALRGHRSAWEAGRGLDSLHWLTEWIARLDGISEELPEEWLTDPYGGPPLHARQGRLEGCAIVLPDQP